MPSQRICFGLALLAAAGLGGCRGGSAPSRFAQVQAAYAAAQSLQWSSEVAIHGLSDRPGMRFVILASDVVLARPRQFRVAVRMDSGGGLEADGLVGSDGTKLWRQTSHNGAPVLLTAPLPAELAALTEDEQAAIPDLLEGSQVINPLRLFYGEVDLAGAEVTLADEPETIDGLVCDGLTIHGNEAWTEHRLWIGRDDHLVHGIDFTTGGEGRTVEVSWRLKNLQVDPPVPPETCAVPAGEGQAAYQGETLSQAFDAVRYGVGRAAPDFALQAVDGQRTIRLADLKGKPAILDFWATWCGPCEMSQPALQKLHEQYGSEVTVVMISDETPAEIAPVVKQRGLTITQLVDPAGKIAAKFGVEGYPTTIYLDRQGIVRAGHAGIDPSGDVFEQLLQPLKPLLPAAQPGG